mgnify:FL=1|tara:strand:- start:395 stop:1561 length:1167 start_codon:yes stop_codon:yes gene_type:complete
MAIPLISNIGFTEVSSAGNLNTLAGSKINMPLQYFKLTGAITGQLTLSENSNHKKVILDTNGNNITNTDGSPLNFTCPSGVPVELKGSGNVQSQKRTFTSTVSDSSNTGTTTIATGGDSTMVVSNINLYPDTSVSGSYQPSFGPGAPNSSSIFQIADGQTGGSNSFGNAWRLRVPSGQTWQVGSDILTAGTDLTASQNNTAIGASNGFDKITSFSVVIDTGAGGDSTRSFHPSTWTSGFAGDSNKYDTNNTTGQNLIYNVTTGRWEGYNGTTFGHTPTGRRGNAAPPQLITLTVGVQAESRRLVFTNNTSHTITLSGGDPFTDTSVAAGATSTVDRTNSTTGSFDITGTFPATNDSGAPLSSVGVNEGTATVNTSAQSYTGQLSVKAF